MDIDSAPQLLKTLPISMLMPLLVLQVHSSDISLRLMELLLMISWLNKYLGLCLLSFNTTLVFLFSPILQPLNLLLLFQGQLILMVTYSWLISNFSLKNMTFFTIHSQTVVWANVLREVVWTFSVALHHVLFAKVMTLSFSMLELEFVHVKPVTTISSQHLQLEV